MSLRLIAGSTNLLSYRLLAGGAVVQPTAISVQIFRPDGSVFVPARALTWNEAESVTNLILEPLEVPEGAAGEQWRVVWLSTYSDSVLRDEEDAEVTLRASSFFTTLEDAKAELNIPESDTRDDCEILGYIERATEAIRYYPGMPPVTFPRIRERRHFVPADGEHILPSELVEAFDVYAEDGVTKLEYQVVPGTLPGSFVRWLHIPTGHEYVTIDGLWGWEVVPPALEQACLVTVETWYKRTNLASEANFIGNLSAIPRNTVELLQQFIAKHNPPRM